MQLESKKDRLQLITYPTPYYTIHHLAVQPLILVPDAICVTSIGILVLIRLTIAYIIVGYLGDCFRILRLSFTLYLRQH